MPIDYSKYPKTWRTEIRPAVMKRAGEVRDANNQIVTHACCEECGVKNHAIIHRFGKLPHEFEYWPEGMESEVWSLDGKKSTKIVLTIAHLDHDKQNNDVSLERLRAWCQKCHLGYDLKNHIRNRKYGREHDKNNHKLDFDGTQE